MRQSFATFGCFHPCFFINSFLLLRAGKLLTELSVGTGPVTDVEFHPHEFLVAAGCKDRTVSYWDLEKFACIGSSERESGPIKCIYFHPEVRRCRRFENNSEILDNF